MFRDACFQKHESGFTLVEMAMVLVVIGLIILAVFPALNALRVSSQRSTTQTNLRALMLATAAYAQANGCLPCPTPASTTGTGFGRVRGDSSASPAACGACTAPEGITPFASLGIAQTVAQDGWGHWISMRVDPALTGNSINFTPVTPPTAPCQCSDFTVATLPTGCSAAQAGSATTPSCTTLNASQKGLCRSGLDATNRISVQIPGGATQQAAVIFVSHGAQGLGSFIASAVRNLANGSRMGTPPGPCTAFSGYALCNADGNTSFVDATYVGGNITSSDTTLAYDDMLAYADRNSLVSKFGNGSCQTVW